MKQLLVEYMPIQYDRQLISEALNANAPVRVKAKLQSADAENQNGRRYPRPILEREGKKYLDEFVSQRRALGELDHPECHRSSCEVMTYNGWKLLESVAIGEMVATLNVNTNALEYQPVQRVINEPYKGLMYTIKGKNIDVLVTPNHRFVLQDHHGNFLEKTAQEIYEMSTRVQVTHLTIPKTVSNWSGMHYDEYEIPGVSMNVGTHANRNKQEAPLYVNAEAWFEFLGLYLAEGHLSNYDKGYGYGVHICQNVGPKADRMRTMLNSLSYELSWTERIGNGGKLMRFSVYDARLHTYLSQLGNKYTKYIPQDIKNASTPLLQNLFNGYLAGDGTTVDYKGYVRTSIFSVSRQLMEDFQEVTMKLGMAGRIKTQVSTKAYAFAGHDIQPENKKPLYRLWIERSKGIHLDFRHLTIEPSEYDGTVHCVTVENGTFYARDKGKAFWSGNSTVVNLKNVSHNIVEMHWEGNDLVGELEVLSTPSGNIVKELMRNGIKLGVSSRGVGSVRQIGENAVQVEDDFNLICFDIVSNPSTHGAFIAEGVNDQIVRTRNERLNLLYVDFISHIGK